MKKFTIKGVLDGFRSSVAQQVKPDQEIVETLRSEHFQVKKTFRHGFPHQPTALAFDPIQKLLAIGTKSGSLRILGTPGVDVNIKHEGGAAVIQLQFLINEGGLLSATADDTLHLWNFRQKIPQVVQSLKFQRERITCMHLPLQSKWLYVGTERGNIHVLHIETFVLSGYIINWNKAIEVSRKTHPGAVIHLSDNPLDLSKILIGYESGQIVLWDLKLKNADWRCQTDEPLRSISWHHEGKQFMCSHSDGSLTTWVLRTVKPLNVNHPHAKTTKEGELEPCKPIQKVEWKLSRNGEAYVIFSGGLAYDTTGRTPSITVIQGKTTTVLEMEHNVVDFITLCESPWTSDFQDPYAVVVLLQNDLVVIDLMTAGFPCFENPYPMDLHESAVTCCGYFADCPSDLVPAFYSVGSKSQKKTGFSEKEWPISGGEWSPNSSSYNEIILTGHADGSIKFWDASAGSLQVLYKLKTAKLFEKSRTRSIDTEEDPLAIQLMFLCPESRKLVIAGAGRHVVLFKFKKVESTSEVVTLDICISSEYAGKEGDGGSPERDFQACIPGTEDTKNHPNENNHPLKVRGGLQKRAAGFQATLICLTSGANGEQPENITALSLNSSYGLLSYGNESGLVIVDIVQKITLLVMSTGDLGGSTDPYQRALRSPKKQDEGKRDNDDKARSPSIDQINQIPRDTTTESESSLLGAPIGEKSSSHSPHQHLQSQQSTLSEDSSGQIGAAGIDYNRDVNEDSTRDNRKAPNQITSHDDTEIRKSSPWKRQFKRQLTRVDLKIKNTFTPSSASSSSSSSNNVASTNQRDQQSKGSSMFYANNTETTEISRANNEPPMESETSTMNAQRSSPHNENQSPETSVTSTTTTTPTSGYSMTNNNNNNNNNDNNDNNDNNGGSDNDRRDSDSVPRMIGIAEELLATRPADLPLFENDDKITEMKRPSATTTTTTTTIITGKGKSAKARLLSVPNLKYQKNDGNISSTRNEDSTAVVVESFAGNLMRRISRIDKLDSSFQRSRSSSMSSLENIATETISCLTFADSYTKKSDANTLPTLWIGTSLGSIQTIVFNTPAPDERTVQPVIISTCNGSSFKLKGSILTMSFLDCNGALVPYSYESWKDENSDSKDRTKSQGKIANSRMSPLLNAQVSSGDGFEDRQFVVLTSEKQARVVALPSQNCVYRQQLAETHIVIKAEITSLKDSVCLVCYVSNGHISIYSLPSLRPLIDVDFLPLLDLRIARTICFSNRGHALYLSSPTEIQKFTVSNEFCSELTEMMGDLFVAHDMPEPPKESFFKGLFGGGSRSLDREELFGESSGRASRTVAKHIPGPDAQTQALRERVSTATGDVAMAHQMVMERGDKLSQLEDRTARMMSEAENFSGSAHGLMLKYKDKKWYQL